MRSDLIKTGNGRIELPTVGECLEHYGEKYFYVEGGLERYYTESEMPSSDARVILLNTKVLPILSNPASNDSDGDGLLETENIQNKWGFSKKDPEFLKKNTFIYFGSDEYFTSLDETIRNSNYTGSEDRAYINEMMDQVNNAVYYEYIPFEYWDRFCTFFNSKVVSVLNYYVSYPNLSETEVIDQDLHYFRNKLNRVPEKLDNIIVESENWTLLSAEDSVYHMFDTEACYDDVDNVYKGEYNLKFVSKDGKYEAVYNYKGELLDEKNDPINMGTYNYGNPAGDLQDKINHLLLDMLPYSDEDILSLLGFVIRAGARYTGFRNYTSKGWFNVPGGYVECSERNKNKYKYDNNPKAKAFRKEIEERF